MLRSLVPDFPSICRTLRNGLTLTRAFLRGKPASSITDWQDWLCDKASTEIERDLRVEGFSAFLPLAAELSPFIGPQFEAVRGPGRIQQVAAQILGARFGASPSCCIHAERERTLPPRDVRHWILEAKSRTPIVAAPTKPSRKPGPDPTPFERTTRHLIGMAVEAELSRTGDRSRKGIIAARFAVVTKYPKLSYDTVKQYHNHTVDWLHGSAS
jgi:hypothetical protein